MLEEIRIIRNNFVHKSFFGSGIVLYLHSLRKRESKKFADVAQLVERNLAKVEVAGSNLVIRSWF